MPGLLNPQQEMFCQEVAKGTPISRAHIIAGYPPSKGNAYRLRIRKRVAARIDELVAQRQSTVALSQINAAEKAGVDAFWVMRTLRRNSVMAARRGDTAASNRAAELIGKHIGMFVEKKQIEISYIDDADEYLAKIMELVSQPVIEHEPHEQQQLEHGGNDGPKYGSEPEPAADTTDIIDELA